MRKTVFVLVALAMPAALLAQTTAMFQPYKATKLRMPSVPLVVNDPYFSVWSPYDNLTDGDTRHWTHDEKPLEGLLRVDGTTYRFMGASERVSLESIVPMADEGAWEAKYTRETPKDGWQSLSFDDSAWRTGHGAWGSDGLNYVNTRWSGENTDLYVRRSFSLNASDLEGDPYLVYSHDDVFEIYINGTQVANTGETWREGVRLRLDANAKRLLHEGKNVIASHCHNTTGGAYTDFGLYKNLAPNPAGVRTARQKSVSVLACDTYYTFSCGPVELDVVFTAPMIIDNLELLSTPINYVSYQVRSTDNKTHDVQFYLSANPLMAVNKSSQTTVSSVVINNGVKYLKTGTLEQPILAKSGDGICIDWGYFYMPDINGDVCLDGDNAIKASFLSSGRLPKGKDKVVCRRASQMPTLAYVHDFGKTEQASSFAMLGYDEEWDMEYFYERYKGYWARDGMTIFEAFASLRDNYSRIMERCRQMDKTIYDDGHAAGDEKYAELLSGAYRHVIAAHKLFEDKEGNLLFFSKENNSNGCVNTVDLTYPESPLFLCYNVDLQKAQITSILDYALSGRWTKPFAAHDIGQYPKANGQVYGGDMPLEEAGNIVTLAAMIAKKEGTAAYVDKYWDVLTTWANYLAENGQDPANQLCTDDFAGHWAHNCNLSIKAIMGVAGYAELARMRGDAATADKYMATAKEMAAVWEKNAFDGDHYRLAFDREGTWSQKYNIIWDRLWGTKVFSDKVIDTEIKYYLKKQNKYGLPLDSRKTYTKNDWIMWTSAMSPDKETFLKFVHPVWDYANETESRVPLSDWYYTDTGLMSGFKARSVIGGFWMKVLVDKMSHK